MEIKLRCKACAHTWSLGEEPRHLVKLTCPACEVSADPRASEDLASAVEDALAQLHQLSLGFSVALCLDSEDIPAAFRAPSSP